MPPSEIEASVQTARHFRIGSMRCRIDADLPRHADYVARFLKEELRVESHGPSHLDLIIRNHPTRTPLAGADGESSFDGDVWRFRRGGFEAEHVLASDPPKLLLSAQGDVGADAVEDYFHLILNRAMINMRRFYLHAAGISFAGKGLLFCGEKGAGKSTLCMAFGGAGGTVLADDHVLLKAVDDRFAMSGTSSVARITKKTEQHFFGDRLRAQRLVVGGVEKKQFDLSKTVRVRPHQDVEVTQVFFPSVTGKIALRPLSKGAALFAWLRHTRHLLVHPHPSDEERYMAFFSRLAGSISTWELELPTELEQLPEVVEYIRTL